MYMYLSEEDKQALADYLVDHPHNNAIQYLGVKLLEENSITLVLEEEESE